MFDYPYRRFHEDGYGKDYAILNFPGGAQAENSNMYLLGCLLTFYQQCLVWDKKAALWDAYNPVKPLWVFLGKTVTAGKGKANTATRSDVVRILAFLGWVLARRDEVESMLQQLLSGKSGLLDDAGRDYFSGRFPHLHLRQDHRGQEEQDHGRRAEDRHIDGGRVYDDLCQTVFRRPGRLRVTYLTAGDGELHLRTSDNDPFGVINVGDSAALYKLLVADAGLDLDIEREMGFTEQLFADVDRPDSPVNVVIGARRFIAGWSSWRVSTMGLMHVGVREGPEIIQMFGRGVRLKGWNMSLKRHLESGAEPPEDSAQLMELEKLYIFGLRANYMQEFRKLMQREGISAEQETFTLPVTWNFAREANLKLIRLRRGRRYDACRDRPVLPNPNDADRTFVTLDLYSRLQSIASDGAPAGEVPERHLFKGLKLYADFFDTARVYERLLSRKQHKNWRNLIIKKETVERLLRDDDWYEIYLPPDRQQAAEFRQVRVMEGIAVELITEYADRFWRKRRRRWEHGQIEIVTLDENDPNRVDEYELSVDATKERLVEEAGKLARTVQKGRLNELKGWYKDLKIGAFCESAHAYQPLLYAREDRVISVQPVPLNKSEERIVRILAQLARSNAAFMQGRELFLIRNLSRGRGVSFFDDFGYYPDFIVWVKDGNRQHVLFLDPKGLARFGRRERKKARLHHEIAETSERLKENDPNLRLHAYILSVTAASKIDDGSRSPKDWKKDGVYFLNDSGCLREIVEHALGQTVETAGAPSRVSSESED